MKKNYFTITFLAVLIMVVAGCKKNIDESILHQGGEITEEQLLQNYGYVKGFLDNIYNTLGTGTVAADSRFNLDSSGAMLASASDEAVNSNLNSPIYTLVNNTWAPSRTFDDGYTNYYTGIRKANLFLENISKGEIKPLNTSANGRFIAQTLERRGIFFTGLFSF